jgi:hypothetical protein
VASARDVEELRQRLLYDTPFWASQCAWIVNKQRKLQRLTPLPWQARTPDTPPDVVPLDEALEKQRAQGMPMRAIILKARKLGFSTWTQAKGLQRITQLPFQNMLTVAHRGDAAADIFDMGQLMYERLPNDPMLADLIYGEETLKGAPFSVKPQKLGEGVSRTGIRHLELGDKMRRAEKSIYRTMTAGAKGGGRAGTPNIVHASEYAHYEDPDYGVGLFNAMPLEPETIGIIESTARGFNHFQQLWQLAVEGAATDIGGVWVPLFYGWQHNPFNALRFVNDQQRERFERTIGDEDGGGDKEEVELVEHFGVTLEQLNWRRAIISGPEAKGSVEWFHQEHPATPEQAFVGSGKPVFPGILVTRAIREAEAAPKPVEGALRGVDWHVQKTRSGTINVPRRAIWVPEGLMDQEPWLPNSRLNDMSVWGAGHLRVWAHPANEVTQSGLAPDKRKPDSQHVVFVDVARGIGNTTKDRDFQAVQVTDHMTRMQVASYRSRIPIHELPLVAYLVALYFNEAWLAVEATGLGIGVVDALAKDYRYRMLYRRHRAGDDERSDARERLLGWETTGRTKPLMEQTMGDAFLDGSHGLRDVPTARQFTTYVEDPKNPAKHGAQTGTFDDLVMSWMGAQRVAAELQPRREGKRKRSRWSPHDDVVGY